MLPLLKGGQLQATQNIVVGLSALTINLWTWLSLTSKSLEQVSSSLGLFASALFIVLSGSPLSTIKTVLATKDSKSILTQLTFAQITNTVSTYHVQTRLLHDKISYLKQLSLLMLRATMFRLCGVHMGLQSKISLCMGQI